MSDGDLTVHLVIRGRVQGVGYRYSALETANRLGLRGWVRNTADGAVEAVAQGSADALESFVRWCERGPAGARVQDVARRSHPPDASLSNFTIRR